MAETFDPASFKDMNLTDKKVKLKFDHDVAVSRRDRDRSMHESDVQELKRLHGTRESLLASVGLNDSLGLNDFRERAKNGELSAREQAAQSEIEGADLSVNVIAGEAKRHEQAMQHSELERKAALWDAHEDYQQNKDAYQQDAIKDATAAGNDVQFDGQSYPAQQAETPKELQAQAS